MTLIRVSKTWDVTWRHPPNWKICSTVGVMCWPAPPSLGRCRSRPQSFIAQVIIHWAAGSACHFLGRRWIWNPFGHRRVRPWQQDLRASHGQRCPPRSPHALPAPPPGDASLPPMAPPCPPATLSSADMTFNLQPDVAVGDEEPASDEVLTPKLQLAIAFEVLHRLDMAEKSRSLSAEELDLVEFLVTQVASLSSSSVVELTCEVAIAVSLAPPLLAREAMNLQPGPVVSPSPPPAAMDASVAVVESSTTPAVAWVLKATDIRESFKVKPPDPAALEVCPKGATSVCSHWSARLVARCRGGTFKHSVSHRRLH
jgi:hypothetical protein